MKALILAAGYGTRLYPYTRNFPKPLLKVNKKPIIEYLLDKLKDLNNISKIIIITNSRFYQHFQCWRERLKIKQKVRIINDLTQSPQDRLGAIRDMDLAFRQENFDDDFLVLGGDNFFQEPLKDFIRMAKKKSPAISIGVFDIHSKQQARHYGVVSLNAQKKVVEFAEKPAAPKSTLVAMCLYYFPRPKLKLIKKYLDNPKNYRDAVGAYIDWLSRKYTVYGFTFKKLWFDIGHIHTYKRLKEIMKGER